MYKTSKALISFITLALFLGACLPAQQQAVPQAQNTPAGLIDVQAQIATSVALTVEAQGQIATFVAQTMEAQPTPQPTMTPIPTFTPFTLVTATNTPWAAAGAGGGGGGGGGGNSGGGNSDPLYHCSVVAQKPYDGDRIWRPKDEFDVTWTLKNTGKKIIPADAYFTYYRGAQLSPNDDFAIGYDVDRNQKFNFTLDIVVPQVDGTEKQLLVMYWALKYNQYTLCTPYIAIFVQNR